MSRNIEAKGDDMFFRGNKTLQKTYILLALTLLFSAFMSYLGLQMEKSVISWTLWIVGGAGILLLIYLFRNSWFGLILVFIFVGWDGYFAGPFIRQYLEMRDGGYVVTWALLVTAILFLSLSFYAFISKQDFNYLGAFLYNILFASVVLFFIGFFGGLELNELAMAWSGIGLFSAYILYDTSRIIHLYESNYVQATIELYLDIVNIFFDLLRVFGLFVKRRVENILD
jgi:modulator of FtsH protease